MSCSAYKGSYTGYIRRKKRFLALLLLLTVLTAFAALAFGPAGLSLRETAAALFGFGSPQARTILFQIRLPRILTAIVAGIGLASAGCIMQSLLKNPLASASTLGVSQGAAFGAAFAITVLNAGVQSPTPDTVSFSDPYLIFLCAFAGSLLPTVLILMLSCFRRVSPEVMILTGAALSSFFSGGVMMLQYFADDLKIAAVVFWTFGNLGNTAGREIAIMAVVTTVSFLFFYLNRWNCNALQTGENSAKGLGVDTDRLRIGGMLIASLTASVIVSYIGIINFVGLIAPHLMRRPVGSDYRYLLPASALCGSLLLLVSDTVSRLILPPVVLPIGAVTTFLGAPLFLFLILKGEHHR